MLICVYDVGVRIYNILYILTIWLCIRYVEFADVNCKFICVRKIYYSFFE